MTNDCEVDGDRAARFSSEIESKRHPDQSEHRLKFRDCNEVVKRNLIEKPSEDNFRMNNSDGEHRTDCFQNCGSKLNNNTTLKRKNDSELIKSSVETKDFGNKNCCNSTKGSFVSGKTTSDSSNSSMTTSFSPAEIFSDQSKTMGTDTRQKNKICNNKTDGSFVETNDFEESASHSSNSLRSFSPAKIYVDRSKPRSTDAFETNRPPPVEVNSLLCFVKNYLTLFHREVVIKGVLQTYSSEEIYAACKKLKEVAPAIDPRHYKDLILEDGMAEEEKTARCILFMFEHTSARKLPMFVSEDLNFPDTRPLERMNEILKREELGQLIRMLESAVSAGGSAENVDSDGGDTGQV